MKTAVRSLVLAALLLVPAGKAMAYDLTGSWLVQFLGLDISIAVNQTPFDTFSAVASVPNGSKTDTYTFAGATFADGTVYALRGDAEFLGGTDGNVISGTISASGTQFDVTAYRY